MSRYRTIYTREEAERKIAEKFKKRDEELAEAEAPVEPEVEEEKPKKKRGKGKVE